MRPGLQVVDDTRSMCTREWRTDVRCYDVPVDNNDVDCISGNRFHNNFSLGILVYKRILWSLAFFSHLFQSYTAVVRQFWNTHTVGTVQSRAVTVGILPVESTKHQHQTSNDMKATAFWPGTCILPYEWWYKKKGTSPAPPRVTKRGFMRGWRRVQFGPLALTIPFTGKTRGIRPT